jgi:probable HAF family extracellular repeat protein
LNSNAQIALDCSDDYPAFSAFVTNARGKDMDEVGSLGGNRTWANGLNDNGVLVGDASIAGRRAAHAWVKQPGGALLDLGTLGGRNSTASKVNNDGLIVGTSEVKAGVVHAFVIQPGTTTMIDIGNLGGKSIQIGGLIQNGIIVGGGYTEDGYRINSAFYAKPP